MVAKNENTLNTSVTGGGLDAINGMAFTTIDRDQDVWASNCASLHGDGGWWYSDCTQVNLNGQRATSSPNNLLQQSYRDSNVVRMISSSEMKMIRVE